MAQMETTYNTGASVITKVRASNGWIWHVETAGTPTGWGTQVYFCKDGKVPPRRCDHLAPGYANYTQVENVTVQHTNTVMRTLMHVQLLENN